jgi:hypothetical protein
MSEASQYLYVLYVVEHWGDSTDGDPAIDAAAGEQR